MKNADIKRLMKIGKSKVFPIIDKTAYIRNGWATSTDYEITLSVPTDINGEGVIDLTPLSKMQGGYDSAEIRDGYLFIKKGNASSKYKLAGPVDEFPIAPACNEGYGALGQFDAEAIASLVPFTGDDETRPVFSGVYVSENFVATDAHKLRWLPNSSKLREIIIPKVAAANIAAGVVSLGESGAGSKYAEVISEKQILNFRLIEGKYPDYEAVIPKDNPIRLEVKTGEFMAALKNALPSANKSTNKIQLVAEAGKLTVSAEDLDFNREYSEEIPASLTGAQMFPIAFNGKFMQVVLDKSIETTVIEMSQPNRAMIVNGNTLLMPVMSENKLQPVFGVKIGKGNNPTFEKMLENLLQLYRKSERDMSFHISQTMAGDGYKLGRQQLVEYITGETLPKAKCGISKIEALCKIRFDEMIAAETPAGTVEETSIQPDSKTGKFSPEPVEPEEAEVIDETPEAEPEPEPENEPEAIEAEVIDETPEPEPEPEPETEDLPELITIVENITAKAFAVVGFTELLPEEFLNKYGSKCKVKVGDERVSGYMFSKKRREALNEAIVAVGITYQTA